jgi:creatinine amidohydrolase
MAARMARSVRPSWRQALRRTREQLSSRVPVSRMGIQHLGPLRSYSLHIRIDRLPRVPGSHFHKRAIFPFGEDRNFPLRFAETNADKIVFLLHRINGGPRGVGPPWVRFPSVESTEPTVRALSRTSSTSLPLAVDLEIPVRIASMLEERLNVIAAPAISYGARSLPQSGGGPAFDGTIHVRGGVLTEYLKDVFGGYVAAGFRSMVILNGHYENESFIVEALELCRQEGMLEDTRIIAAGWWSFVSDAAVKKLFGDRFPGWQASTCETSLMLHLRRGLVGTTRIDNATPPKPGIYLLPVDPAKISNREVLEALRPRARELVALCVRRSAHS